jgi:hypothetical protein
VLMEGNQSVRKLNHTTSTPAWRLLTCGTWGMIGVHEARKPAWQHQAALGAALGLLHALQKADWSEVPSPNPLVWEFRTAAGGEKQCS